MEETQERWAVNSPFSRFLKIVCVASVQAAAFCVIAVSMNWKNRAAQMKAAQDAAESESQKAIDKLELIRTNADGLWDSLASALMRNVKEFADELPFAKERQLRAVRLFPNSLIINTMIYPLLHFEITYLPRTCINAVLRTTQNGRSEERIREFHPIRFTADRNMQVYLTDGERYLTAAQVSDELMEYVAAFLGEAMHSPDVLT